MLLNILFVVFLIVTIADFIRALLWQRQVKKKHIEQLESQAKLSDSLNNLNISPADILSIKRHIRMLLHRLDEKEKKIEEEEV